MNSDLSLTNTKRNGATSRVLESGGLHFFSSFPRFLRQISFCTRLLTRFHLTDTLTRSRPRENAVSYLVGISFPQNASQWILRPAHCGDGGNADELDETSRPASPHRRPVEVNPVGESKNRSIWRPLIDEFSASCLLKWPATYEFQPQITRPSLNDSMI